MVKQDSVNMPLDAPIAGQSLTAPVGDRPWQRPSRYADPDDALAFYMDRITKPRMANQMMDILEMGIPVDTLVDMIQAGGVMEGLHNIDVGIIISPALAEAISSMADAAEITYTKISEPEDKNKPYDTEIANTLREMSEETGEQLKDIKEEPAEIQDIEQKSQGLMARR